MTSHQNRSFWEQNIWSHHADVIIVGGGIVGLHAALEYHQCRPDHEIMVIEKGITSRGSSTKNAGFVCIGSPSELLSDLKKMSETELMHLLSSRYAGAEYLRSWDHDRIHFVEEPGYEVFAEEEKELYQECMLNLGYLNEIVRRSTGIPLAFEKVDIPTCIKDAHGVIRCNYEGHIHPGKWIEELERKCDEKGIRRIMGVGVDRALDIRDSVMVETSEGHFTADQVLWCTNAYSSGLFPLQEDVRMVKNQVYAILCPDLCLTGTYHMKEGFIYLRKFENHLIIGGARHMDDDDVSMEYNMIVEAELRRFVERHLGVEWQPSHKWMGRLAMGANKSPIIDQLSNRQWAAYRLGGMGVALGAHLGKALAQKVVSDD